MTAAISMETFLAHLNRPGATPAPTTPRPTPAEPFPSPFPSGPRVTEKACGCGVLAGERCDCRAMRRQLRAANRQPIFFDYRKPEAA